MTDHLPQAPSLLQAAARLTSTFEALSGLSPLITLLMRGTVLSHSAEYWDTDLPVSPAQGSNRHIHTASVSRVATVDIWLGQRAGKVCGLA